MRSIYISAILLYTLILLPLPLHAQSDDDEPASDTSSPAYDEELRGKKDPGDANSDDSQASSEDEANEATAGDAGTPTRPAPNAMKDASRIRLLYPPPACLNDTGSTSLGFADALREHFETHRGTLYEHSSGLSVQSNGRRVILPADSMFDAASAAKAAGGGVGAWTIVEEAVPVLVSPYEMMFQYPYRGHFDWLTVVENYHEETGRFPDARRVEAKLLKGKTDDGSVVYRLELPDSFHEDPIFMRRVGVTSRLRAPDDSVSIHTIGSVLGRGSRVVPRLEQLREGPRVDQSILLLPGNVSASEQSPKERALCGDLTRHLNPMAIVPRAGELGMGPSALGAFAEEHGLRYIAANLVSRKTGEHTFRRFSMAEVDDLTIAVIGIVGRDQIGDLPATVARKWEVRPPRETLLRARRDLVAQLQREPDLTVVLVSSDSGADAAAVASVPGVDIVIGAFDRASLLPLSARVETQGEADREGESLLRAGGNEFGVGEIVATFGDAPTGRRLEALEHRIVPVPDRGDVDVRIEEEFAPVRTEAVSRQTTVVLPDVTPIIRDNPELAALSDPSETLSDDEEDERPVGRVERYSDGLWMRLVTNVLRDSLDADVALSTRLARSQNVTGAVTRNYVDDWLATNDTVRRVKMTGARLRRLARIVTRERGDAAGEEEAIIFSGYDPQRQKLRGRAVIDDAPYTVAVTDRVLDDRRLQTIFEGVETDRHFVRRGSAFIPSPDGDEALLRDVVLASLKSWGDDGSEFDMAGEREVAAALSDASSVLEPMWLLRVDEISLRGSIYQNSDNIDQFGTTRETRLTTPDTLAVGARIDINALYDARAMAWETGIDAVLDRVDIDDATDTPASERADDAVVFSEVRAKALGFDVAESGVPLIPFVRGEYDTEFTPTPDPTNPSETAPHQQLARALLGLTAYPGSVLREVRLAPAALFEFSDGSSQDYGARFGYELRLPIVGPVHLDSRSDLEYYVPDGDDDSSDLALRIDSRNKIVVDVWRAFSFFAYADVYLGVGKTDANDSLGGSYIVGAGAQFSEVFKF